MIKETIRKEMKDRGDKPLHLAKATGIPSPRLYQWFNNKPVNLTLPQIELICEHYNLILVKNFKNE